MPQKFFSFFSYQCEFFEYFDDFNSIFTTFKPDYMRLITIAESKHKLLRLCDIFKKKIDII